MWKAGKEVLEKFEDLNGIIFVELKGAVERDTIVVRKFKSK